MSVDNPARSQALGRQVAVVLRARLLTSLLDTATVIVAVRLVAKDEFGVLQLLLVVYEFGRFVATFGFPDSLYYFTAKLPEDQHRALALRTFGILAVGGVLVGICLALASTVVTWWLPRWEPTSQAQVAYGLRLLALVALIELPTWALYPLLVASGQGGIAGRFEVITSLGAMAALVLPLVLGHGVVGVLWGLVAYALARAALTVWLVSSRLPARGGPLPRGFLRLQGKYAVPLGLHTVVGRLNKYVDKIIVGTLLAETLLAEYGVASTEVPVVTVFPYAVGSVLLAHYVRELHRGRVDAALELWLRAAKRVSLLVIPVGVLVIAAAEDLVVTFAGAEYRAASVPFAIVASLLLHRVVQYGGMLQAQDDTRGILRITLIIVVLNVLISVPLTLTHGIAGTAAGTVIAQWFGWALYVRRIARGLSTPVARVMPWAHMARVLALSTAAALVALSVRWWALPEVSAPIGATAMTAVFLLVYLPLGKVLRVIDRAAWRSLGMLAGLGGR